MPRMMDTTKKNETQLQPQPQPHPRFLKSYIEDNNVFEAFNFCQFFLFERISLLIKDN